MTKLQLAFIAGGGLLHVGMYVGMGLLPKEKHYDSVAIALAEQKKKEKPKKPPPPPPPPPPVDTGAKAKVAKVEPKETVAPPPPPPTESKAGSGSGDGMDGFADIGFSMGGNSGGIALPGGGGGGGPAPKPTTEKKNVVKQLAAADPGCSEDVVKPAMEHQVQPAYTLEAKQANVEGKVRLEITIDATGHVTSVKVLKGLGFGLDEAAISAAKQYTFKPATKCGKAVPTTIKLGVNFGFK